MSKKIGLIGCGYWGKNLARNLHDMRALGAVCDTDREKEQSIRESYGGVPFTSSYRDILDDAAIDAVAIATPAATHYAIAKETIESGKDVFVEKPLALTAAEGKEIVSFAERKGRVLMVGHVLQYHPAVIKLKKLIAEGRLGKVQYIYSNRLNIGKLRTEENILWSFAPHDISVILMLLGAEPERVAAFGGCYLNTGIYDTTLTSMEFKNDVKAHIFVSWLHPFKEQKMVVVGSQAMAVFNDTASDKLLLYPHKIEWKNGITPFAQKAEHEPVPVEKGEPLGVELRHFLECLTSGRTPRTDGNEGLRVLKVLEAAEDALTRNGDLLRV